MPNKTLSQNDIIVEFFKNNPNRDIEHPEVVDWAVRAYKERTGAVLRDPDRAIRKLAQNGFLIKIAKGVYKYDPDKANIRALEDFTPTQRKEIFERDGYKCVICGKGKRDGVELHADHSYRVVPAVATGVNLYYKNVILSGFVQYIPVSTLDIRGVDLKAGGLLKGARIGLAF
ncbi:HNH endonuclease [Deferribacterales bacterium RsTz2092]